VNPDPATKRPAQRRPFSFLRPADALFAAVLALAIPAFIAFAWHDGLATVSDDSVSYLVQARVYAGGAPEGVREWLGNAAHFPPLFPLLLAATGGAHDFLRAHLVVALAAGLALLPLYAFAARRAGRGAATVLVVLFLLTPTAWVSELGILSEPLFLLLSFWALAWHARLAAEDPTPRDRILFGVVLAAALLTRSAGVALVAAYAAWAVMRAWRQRNHVAPLLVPLVPVVVALVAWIAVRPPLQGENYEEVLRNAWRLMAVAPSFFAAKSLEYLGNAWVGTFTAESHVYGGTRIALLAVAFAALAGAVRAAWRNRIDGWYALAYAAMLAFWLFPEETTRRLLYPVVPLALLHAGEAVHAAGTRLVPRRAAWLVAAGGLLVAAFSLPAVALVAAKAADRTPVMSISPLAYSGITEYYTTIPVKPAREVAGRQLAVLAGLAQVEKFTPAGARVLWMRPDYVAVLSHRTGVPWYYRDGMPGVVRQLLDSRAGYVVVASLYKADIRGEAMDPIATPRELAAFTHPLFIVRNPVTDHDEFGLLEVDRPALERYAARLREATGR
jgi:hypothetical protein